MFSVIVGLLTLVYIKNILYGSYLKMRPLPIPELPKVLPSISVIVPVFNEGLGVYGTIESLSKADYPLELFTVTIVDDCSTDDTAVWINKAIKQFSNIKVYYIKQKINAGKQAALFKGVHATKSDLLVFFDSDVRVDSDVLKAFARELQDPKIGVVGSSCGIYNTNDNLISQGYSAVFYSMHEWLKQVESATGCISVVDGKAIGFRREVYQNIEPIIKEQWWLGLKMMAGEDRHVTHQLTLLGYNSKVFLERVNTSAPPNLIDLYKQQLRWRRSGLRDYFITIGDIRNHVLNLGLLKTSTILLSRTTYILIPFLYLWIIASGGIVSVIAATTAFFAFVVSLRLVLNFHAWVHHRDQFITNPFFSSLALSCWMTVDLILTTPLAILTLDEGGWGTRNLSTSTN